MATEPHVTGCICLVRTEQPACQLNQDVETYTRERCWHGGLLQGAA
jgi:hypothetical protein